MTLLDLLEVRRFEDCTCRWHYDVDWTLNHGGMNCCRCWAMDEDALAIQVGRGHEDH